MGLKEKAVEIRKALKAKGWGPKEVSVRCEFYSLGESLHVVIKSAAVPIEPVKEIAKTAEHVRYCQYSGEILGGGNTYVHVSYARETLAPLVAELAKEIEPIEVGGFKMLRGYQVAREDEHTYELVELGGEGECGKFAGKYWKAEGAAEGIIHKTLGK